MKRIDLREFREHAGRYVGMARLGEPVEISARGTPVAFLVPATSVTHLDRLTLAGRLSPPIRRDDDPLVDGQPLAPSAAELPSQTLQRQRSDVPGEAP